MIVLKNTSVAACSLEGFLGIALPARGTRILQIDVVHDGIVGARGFELGKGPVRPATVVLGSKGASVAWVGVRWRNWCGGSLSGLGIELILPGGGVVAVPPQGLWQTASCASASARNVLVEGPVQAPAS